MAELDDLLAGAQAGERRPLARLLTAIEGSHPALDGFLPTLFAASRGAHVVGVTGPPGSGKSTLVSALTAELRRRGRRVGIIAVDPSSPYSGGAIMGDRIRMMDHAADRDVFMRSMASRGELGGLASTTWIGAAALDAAGFDPVLIETVGAGQSEVEIARLAETTVVVEPPEGGDEIQAIKAGLLEVADVIAVNKADRPDAARTARQLRAMMSSAGGRFERRAPPVIMTTATTGQGVPELVDAIAVDRERARRPEAARRRAADRLRRAVADRVMRRVRLDRRWDAIVDAVAERRLDPITGAATLNGSAGGARLHHVQVACPAASEAELRRFYGDLLGMQEIPKPPALAARGGCWFRLGQLELHVGVDDDFEPARKAHPAIETPELDAIAERLAAAGHEIAWDAELPGMRRFHVHDPNGNRLEFLAPDNSVSP